MAELAPVRNTIAFAASYAAAARHTIRHHAITGLRWAGLLPQPVADHQAVILAGQVAHMTHPETCLCAPCPVIRALDRTDPDCWPAGIWDLVLDGPTVVFELPPVGGGR